MITNLKILQLDLKAEMWLTLQLTGGIISKRYSTKHPGNRQLADPGARRVWHAFLQSRYCVLWTLRVSRHKDSKWLGCYPGIVILLTIMARSGFVSYPITVFKAEAKSKNHDKLIKLSVLCLGAINKY
jgi:hypothetical protein